MIKALLLIGVAIVAGIYSAGFESQIHPPSTPAGLEAHETAAGASVLGQVRTSAASTLYLRTDLYLHGGVELRPMTSQEKQAGRQGADVHPDDQAVLGDESHLVTAIPPKEVDFRGFFGDLERATGAYHEMHNHKHNDPETAFPLFRLMTWVDPQFITGWTTGSMLLADPKKDPSNKEALAYLKEGLGANPTSPEIMTRIGVLTARAGDIPAGLQWFEKARSAALENGTQTAERREALVEVYRWLLIAADRMNKSERVKEIAQEAYERYPDDQVVLRFAIKSGVKVNLPEQRVP
jgi:hypothetical protein